LRRLGAAGKVLLQTEVRGIFCQNAQLFLKFTPKRAGSHLRRFVGTLSPHPCKLFEKGLSENFILFLHSMSFESGNF